MPRISVVDALKFQIFTLQIAVCSLSDGFGSKKIAPDSLPGVSCSPFSAVCTLSIPPAP
jgi:hypothetical protein